MTSKRVTIIVKPSLTAETDAPMTQTLTKQQLLSAFRHKEGKVRASPKKPLKPSRCISTNHRVHK